MASLFLNKPTQIILVSVGNLQQHIFYNIYNLLLFNNNNITIITEKPFFKEFNEKIQIWKIQFPNQNIQLVDCSGLNDFGFNQKSNLDKTFRNGFWHLTSLRFFYLFSYIQNNNIQNIIHLENDVMSYVNYDVELLPKFTENKVYATFDFPYRVIPGIIYIPNYQAFSPIIQNYNPQLNDMQNLALFDETIILPLPILSNIDPCPNIKCTRLYSSFKCIFDAAAMGQYLGGIDPKNDPTETRGFINETCVIKYNEFLFNWIKIGELYKPHLSVNNQYIPIINLHIHSKKLECFLSDHPIENKYIKFCREPTVPLRPLPFSREPTKVGNLQK
jgi:hypothetical protein